MKRKNLRFCSRQRREERRESERERERRKAEEKNTQSGAAAAAAGKGNARADTYYLLLIHPSRNELYVQKNSSDNGHSLIDYLFISTEYYGVTTIIDFQRHVSSTIDHSVSDYPIRGWY